jgi:hypothetical protein
MYFGVLKSCAEVLADRTNTNADNEGLKLFITSAGKIAYISFV